MGDVHAPAAEADEPGVLTISRKTAKALAAAAAAEHAATHGHADSAEDFLRLRLFGDGVGKTGAG